jgi:uncharacterized protein (TIGR02466 family)
MGRVLMEVINAFPVEFFVFKNKDIDNQELIKKLERLDNVEIKKTTTLSMLVDLRNLPEFSDLFSWFKSCLEEVRQGMKFDCDRLEISNSWFNVAMADYKMYQNYHRHSMSFYSAVYYLTGGSSTIFEDPVRDRSQAQIEVLRHDYQPTFASEAEPGKLIIFPSWVYHNSRPHLESFNRYVISFNVFPAGKINYNLATDSKLEVEIK